MLTEVVEVLPNVVDGGKKLVDTYAELTVRERSWLKLYMLQNYKVDMKYLKGAHLGYKTILAYQNVFRNISSGLINASTVKAFPFLVEFDKVIRSKGIQPFPKMNEYSNSLELVGTLLDKKILTESERTFICSSITQDIEQVTTKAVTPIRNNYSVEEYHRIIVKNYRKPLEQWRHRVPHLGDATVKNYVKFCMDMECNKKSSVRNHTLERVYRELTQSTPNITDVVSGNSSMSSAMRVESIIDHVESDLYFVFKDNAIVYSGTMAEVRGYMVAVTQFVDAETIKIGKFLNPKTLN